MYPDPISTLREVSRKLVRELGILQLNKEHSKKTPQHWHTLIEIAKEPGITISKLGGTLLLSTSAMSRIVSALIEHGLVCSQEGADKRERYLHLTPQGHDEVESIDEFSNVKIKGAFEFLTEEERIHIITAIQKYGEALEQSRLMREQFKIHTISTSRIIRKQIIAMIENIQKHEFSLPITDDINLCILKTEEHFYYHNSYNFWYAVDNNGVIIGSIGLKKIDNQSAEIKKFFVDQRYRGKGVALKLIALLCKAATKHEFNSLYLGTVDKLEAAKAFYKKYGFIKTTKQQLPIGFSICNLDTDFWKIAVQELQVRLQSVNRT